MGQKKKRPSTCPASPPISSSCFEKDCDEPFGMKRLEPYLLNTVRKKYPYLRWPLFTFIAWTSLVLLCSLFYIVPITLLSNLVCILYWPFYGLPCFLFLMLLSIWPNKEWPGLRGIFSIWVDVFKTEHSVPLPILDFNKRYVVYAAPHGIIPIPISQWGSFFNTYWPENYGVLGVSPILFRLPFIRQIVTWLGCVPANFETLKNYITEKERGVMMYPGGIAEIFLSSRKKEAIYLRERKGFVKLALMTGAELRPVYFFGATSMFDQTGQAGGWLSRISRKMKGCLTFFWGQWYLPIPYSDSRVSIAIGEAVAPARLVENPTQEDIDELHSKCLEEMMRTFERYKHIAGYGHQTLEIH